MRCYSFKNAGEVTLSTTNFIISAYQALWDKNVKDLYVVEPYVFHVLEKESRLKQYNNIEVAPFSRTSRADIDNVSRYVDAKYNKYIAILSTRLNEIHGTTHKEFFWKKALSMAFIRYITIFHDLFEKCEMYLDEKKHTANILSVESYCIPLDFEDHRYFFQNTGYGQEQIFSIYAKLFYPGVFPEMQQCPAQFDKEITHSGLKNNKALTAINKIKNMVRGFILSLLRKAKVSEKDIKVGIVGSYFSEENFAKLINNSDSKIYPLEWSIHLDHEDKDISWDERNRLAEFDPDFDRFDKFFFSTMPYCLPRVFVEHYNEIESSYSTLLNGYSSLQYIVSEGWISDTFMSILLALAQEKGIKHVNNEHNCFFHPFAGSFISHVVDMSDIFVTLGWYDPNIKGLVKGASLFPFSIKNDFKKECKILYVSAPANVKMPHYSSAWGIDEENAVTHLDFCKSFFKNLKIETLKELVYRAYPKTCIPLLSYDKEYMLSPYLNQIRSLSNTSEPSKVQMLKSDMVIIDYISTSYIEALVMNIPTVFFCNKDAYYLNDNYLDFFDVLIDAGICQTDPVQAAHFVESIKDEPEKWWSSEKVQAARNNFLNRNLGKPEDMIEYLLGLISR
mgnify:CR=1 FL=1